MKKITVAMIALLVMAFVMSTAFAAVSYDGKKVLYDINVKDVADVKLDDEYVTTVSPKDNGSTFTITRTLTEGLHYLTIGSQTEGFIVKKDAPTPVEDTTVDLTKTTTTTLEKGATKTVVVSGKTIKSVKTSNKKAATIAKDGTLKGIAAGTAKITITCTDKKKYTLNVTVTDPFDPVTVALTPLEGNYLNLKQSVTLTPDLTPKAGVDKAKVNKDKVTWTTSNKKIVTVDKKGKITGKKVGTATITATIPNGQKASLTIEVVDLSNPTTVQILEGGERVTATELNLTDKTTSNLTVVAKNFLDKEVSTKLSWKSSNKKVVTVDKKGKIVAKKAGTATITVTTKNKLTATVTVTVK